MTTTLGGTYARLRAALAVDMLRFDQELVEIPQLIQEAAEEAANAAAKRDAAKHQRDMAIADASYTMRNIEGKPPSETQIASEVTIVAEVQEAREAYIEAERIADTWRALVEALKNKKEILRTLSDQMMAGFLSPTSIVKDARKEMASTRQETISRRRPVT